MLKQAFKFLGIGFFLSGCLLLTLSYSGYLKLKTDQLISTLPTQSLSTTSTNSKTLSETTKTTTQQTSSTQVETTQQTTLTNEAIKIAVEENEDSHHIAEKLKEQHIISNANEFVNYLVDNHLDTIIQNGTFTIPKNSNFEQLGKILTTYPGNQ